MIIIKIDNKNNSQAVTDMVNLVVSRLDKDKVGYSMTKSKDNREITSIHIEGEGINLGYIFYLEIKYVDLSFTCKQCIQDKGREDLKFISKFETPVHHVMLGYLEYLLSSHIETCLIEFKEDSGVKPTNEF